MRCRTRSLELTPVRTAAELNAITGASVSFDSITTEVDPTDSDTTEDDATEDDATEDDTTEDDTTEDDTIGFTTTDSVAEGAEDPKDRFIPVLL
jgi:hypothetical protein